MRAEFARVMVDLYDHEKNLVFLTGDLGYMALEEVRRKFGQRFINAGVAEQNMICVAAGLAHEGFIPWVYDIAPFAVLRPYEQIRNDVCLHNLPVKLVGNGGGYGYGIMGATHHTLEDIGVLRALPNMRIYLPFVPTDVAPAVRAMVSDPSPNYLRLNLGHEMTFPVPPFGPWRRLRAGSRGVVIGIGPVLGNMFSPDVPGLADDLEVWNPGILPIHELPPDLVQRIGETRKILTIEEHGGQCGFHEAVARLLVGRVTGPLRFTSLFATGYPSGKYGSQRWHQEENDLAGDGLRSRFHEAFDD